MTLRHPTKMAAIPTTLAEIFAAEASVAPMRLATRVEPAMERGKGIWKVRDVRVARTD